MQNYRPRIRLHTNTMLKHGVLVLAALTLFTASAQADTVFDKPDASFNGRVFSPGVAYPGGDADVRGGGFKPGQEIQLLRSGTNVAKDKVVTADKDGNFNTSIAVPADAATGIHPIVVQVAKPSAAAIFEFKISAPTKLSGADKFAVKAEHIKPGLYQSAYGAASKALFVTSSVGRPPVKDSALSKVNPDTLKVEASITPAVDADNDKGQVHAVYGVAVDDSAGTVWVTNTRSGTVAVYKQSDLSLVKQFPNKLVPHARDVAIDSERHRAYVSAATTNEIVVFDTDKLEQVGTIAIQSKAREAANPMSLAIDAKSGKLYTVSRTTNEAIVIDLKKQAVAQIFPLVGAKGTSGVAVAPDAQVLFVASQGSDNVQLVSLKDGTILHDINVGAGPLNVAWDPKDKLAYVAIRGGSSVAVINLDGKLVANLDGGSYPNHISTDGRGTVFVVNKAKGKDDKTGDRVSRITMK